MTQEETKRLIRYYRRSGRVDWGRTIMLASVGEILNAQDLAAAVRPGISNGTARHANRALIGMCGGRWGHNGEAAKTLQRTARGEYTISTQETQEK